MPVETIGFVGIGAMGAPMAGHLARAGYPLVVFDANPQRASAFAENHPCRVARGLPELGAAADVVVTMLPDGATVRRVLCGENDSFAQCVAAGLRRGAIVLEMSSSSPLGTRQLGALLEPRGVRLLDAPVSGGVKRARSAELAIMVGGDGGTLETCRPILEKMGNAIFHAGPLGAGHAVKALNNYVSAAGLVAACEAVIAARRFGLDPETVVDILNASSGMNNTTKVKLKPFMLSGTFDAGFTAGLMAKDLRTALELAEALGAPAPLARPCIALWNEMEARLGPAADHTEMYRYLERLAQ